MTQELSQLVQDYSEARDAYERTQAEFMMGVSNWDELHERRIARDTAWAALDDGIANPTPAAIDAEALSEIARKIEDAVNNVADLESSISDMETAVYNARTELRDAHELLALRP